MKDEKEYAKAFASKGGTTTFKKYGKEHFRKIALDRWEKVRKEKENAQTQKIRS